ncbi:MAG: GDSL-type esterase/lipase family protein [Prosthecobacter sp.]
MIYRRLFCLLLLVVAAATPAFAVPVPDPARFEKAIAAFEAEDAAKAPPKDVTLFVGASNIRRWRSLPERFKKTPVLNRGFGGCHLSDMVHFFDRTVAKYQARQIYINSGGNDLNAGRTPEEVLAAFEAFVAKAKSSLPEAKLCFISIPVSPSRRSQMEQVKQANSLIAASCAKSGVDFLNTFPYLLDKHGEPRPELYVEDRLHYSEAGYDVITSVIKWQGEMKRFAKEDAEKAPPASPIVFTGSSSIRMWKTLAEDFPGLPVMNRGFGGSEIFDSANFADTTVIQYKPKQVVLYAGGNDIAAGKTPQRVFEDYKAFVAKIHAALPDCEVCYISNAPNPKRWSMINEMRETSRLVEEHVKTDKRLKYINTHDAMLGADGQPKPDIFLEDKLHMNPKGYVIWKGIVGPYLMK